MLLNARQVKTVENSSRHILLAIEDITDRKLRDELMRDLNGKLTRSNRELQDFAQVASHDLQEPLRKIQWFGDRLSNAAETVLNDACRDIWSTGQRRVTHAVTDQRFADVLAY